jgi:hypothetical protein
MSAHQYDEGHTVAGWTGVGIATVGTSVLGVGVCLVSIPLIVLGIAIDVVSLLVTWVLHLTGWGKASGPRPREEWPMRVRDTGARAGHAGCVGCQLAGRGVRRAGRTAVGSAAVGSAETGRTAEAAGGPAPAGGEPAPAAATSGG